MKRRCVIDEGIGETRAAIYEGRHLVELHLDRWSDRNRPRRGDTFIGRIVKIDKGMSAAFVDLGALPRGFLRFSDAPNAPHLIEGAFVEVKVSREDETEKGPVLNFISMSKGSSPGPKVQTSFTDRLINRFGGDIEIEFASVQNFSGLCETEIAIPGGGDIAIEPTRALIAIDVDRGSAQSGYDVAKSACSVIARQLRLRGLGGLIAIDFPNLRQRKQRDSLISLMTEAVKTDPAITKIAPLSRFGVLEMTRQKTGRSLDEILMDRNRQETAETLAIKVCQMCEKEARLSPGAQLTMSLPQSALDWLNDEGKACLSELSERIGERYRLIADDSIYVKADR